METAADRDALLRGLGAQEWTSPRGCFTAIFDNEFIDANGIEDSGPALTLQTADVVRLDLKKGVLLEGPPGTYRVRRPEADGTGMSRLVLEQ